jgi:hypothetical protein
MQDDAFYYLQPAWLYKSLGYFTFDGVNKTYGFHPLWMITLTALAHTTTDKIFFLREALVLSAILYFATGVAIYFLMKRFVRKWIALIPAAIWLLNTDLQNAFVSGMENCLVAFLLVCFLIVYSRWKSTPNSMSILLSLGLFSGLLFLGRISMLMVFILLVAAILYQLEGWRGKIRAVFAALAGFLAVVLPWALYAFREFGTLFPNSGARKLVGSFAGLIAAIQNSLPFFNLHWLTTLLPTHEQLLLTRPSELMLPNLSSPLDFVFGYLPARTYSFGFFSYLKSVPPQERLSIRIVFYAVVLLIAAGLIILGWKKRETLMAKIRGMVRRIHLPETLGFLLLLAAIDFFSLALLLPSWLHSIWYTTAETLAYLLLPALFLNAIDFESSHFSRRIKNASGFIFAIALAGVLLVSAERLSLRHFEPKPEHIDEAWIASSWMNANIPNGSRVASWSSGLLGYFAAACTVTNLDGLANSPEFVRDVFIKGKLYSLGLYDQNVVWQYIQHMGIRYLADSEFESRLGTHDFFRSIPSDHYTIIYRGSQMIDWHEPEGRRVFTIIHLIY